MSCTSGFADDVMLERNGREYAMREKRLFYIFKLAQQTTSTNRGAESNIYTTVLLYTAL